MVIRSRHGGNVQLRTFTEFGSSAIPAPGSGFAAYTGRGAVTVDRAIGLPAVGSVIRQICGAVAVCDLDVYRAPTDDDETPGTPADDTWQAQLFDNPTQDDSEFDFLSDLAAGIEGFGNSFFLKIKAPRTGEVLELQPLPPDYVQIRRDGGRKVFDVALPGNGGTTISRKGLTTGDVLHIPAFRFPGLLSGLSPIQQHRVALDRSLALEEYAGRFFSNDSTPPFAIVVPGKITAPQGRTMLDVFEASHSGLTNAHRPALLSNGATVQTLGVSLKDAQFIEGSNLTTRDVAQIWNWPEDLLAGGETSTTARLSVEQLGLRLLTFSVAPRLRRIEKALLADVDLFPRGSGLFPRFTTHDLIRLDASTLASVVHSQIQDGMLNPNEGRAEFGRPPRPGGDEYLQTPVGAAPNDAPAPADPSGTLEKP